MEECLTIFGRSTAEIGGRQEECREEGGCEKYVEVE